MYNVYAYILTYKYSYCVYLASEIQRILLSLWCPLGHVAGPTGSVRKGWGGACEAES